ncbi:pogo transposable element with krab domain-like [Colletotrichum incanum]|uniref:Pogo transposable element with krab domain-like n=1 Tax=Colletotrichum incanum TaxID=1573173 RepID=A0A167EBB4_COLIC|nr:pogo transposable element with krab domain-like [Colletotrichum incanum]
MPNRLPLGNIDPNALQTRPPQKKPRGKKPTSIINRSYSTPTQAQRSVRSYSQRKRVTVVMYLEHHRYLIEPWPATRQRAGDTPLDPTNGLRRPTFDEAAEYFKIPHTTVILVFASNAMNLGLLLLVGSDVRQEPFLLADTLTYLPFASLLIGLAASAAAGIFPIAGLQSKPQSCLLPADYLVIVTQFLHFNRRVSQPSLAQLPLGLSTGLRFPTHRSINFDETPIPFEYLDGLAWADKGARTVAGKTGRSGWRKRQPTLILCIFADVIQRILPRLIFHGKPSSLGCQTEGNEGSKYSSQITFEFNDTAYNNEYLLDAGQEYLLVMDVAAFHKTPSILSRLRTNHITLSLIPPGTTSLLQPLHTAVNKPFKQAAGPGSWQPIIWTRIKIKDTSIETVSWDGWGTFNCDNYVKEEMLSYPEILEDANGDNTKHISTVEDVQQPIGSNRMAPVDLTRPARPWDL